MNRTYREILKTNPHRQEYVELSSYEKTSKDFYKILLGKLEKEDEFSDIQLEIIIELIEIFTSEVRYFEDSIKNNPRASKKFETIFLTKEKFFERILQRYSRYLSIICFGNLKNLPYINLKTLRNEFREGLGEVIDVVERDIPKYEILFNELDELQQQGKKFEIYLGRDGVYAFEARRATDIARRRKLKKEDFKKREIIKIKPKYINFNTTIKEYYSEENRKKYLESNEILPEQDLIIFDTGFTGSIPEQILKTLGYKDPNINHRIKILGTTYFKNNGEMNIDQIDQEKVRSIQMRMVKGLLPNLENYLHVDVIEERPKKVMTASGIFENVDGKLKPVENPYFNKFFFQYELIELAIRQYFYNKEYF